MIVVLNPGHAKDTPGKCSPDKSLFEWEWNRRVAHMVHMVLTEIGISNVIAQANSESESLTYPVMVANETCKKFGSKNVIFVSIHCNAAGKGGWSNARGWSVYTTKGQTEADKVATCLWECAAETFGKNSMRKEMSDGDPDYEANFYVLRKTNCPAVLIEHFFMDNKDDLEFLKTEESKMLAADVIVSGIVKYLHS